MIKNFFHYVGLFLCVTYCVFFFSSYTYAQIPASDDLTVAIAQNEVLEKNFIQLNEVIDFQNELHSVNPLQQIKNLSQQWVQLKQSFFSLLNWSQHTRPDNELEIDNYDRKKQFGTWINDPNDDVCYNTRAKVLVRDSIDTVSFKENNSCVVSGGLWNDPYSNGQLKEASQVQIDHVVPLKNAYVSGAYNWTNQQRCLYANYMNIPFHLLSVSGKENMKKSDKGPEKYLPPHSEYTCEYLHHWLVIKMIWSLTLTLDEANSVRQLLVAKNCPLDMYKISEQKLQEQRQYIQNHQDFCLH